MGILKYITKSISGLARPQRWFKDVFDVEPTIAGVEVTPEGALTCSAVAACSRLLSESVASLPLHVYAKTATSKERDAANPLYPVLHSKPNPYQTSYTWRAQAMMHVLLHGNAYSVIERDDSGRAVALWPLLPESVVVKVIGGEVSYEYHNGGQRQSYAFDQMVHLKGPSLNGVVGISMVTLARQGIGLALAQDQHGASMFRNSARPSVLLKYPHMLTNEQRATIRATFEKTFAGALNAGKPFVLEGGMDVTTVGFSAEDAQYLQSRQFSVQEVARWFRVSPTMIGDLSRSTYSNSEQEQLSFLQHSLRPWLVNIEAELNSKLFADDSAFAEFDMSGIARGDQQSRYTSYAAGLAAGFLTVADVRAWENLPEIAGTDVLNPSGAPAPLAAGGNNGPA